MKQTLLLVFICACFQASSQQFNQWQVAFQLQQELTFHKNQYSFRWKDRYTTNTLNMGLGAFIQYNLSDKFFADAGLSFISRKLNTTAFLDQSRLPVPYYSTTKELNYTKYILLRTVEVPVHVGYNFFKSPYTTVFVKAGFSPNYLLNSYYQVAQKYRANYKKAYWQGYSLNAAIGFEQKLSSKFTFTGHFSYAFRNTVKEDPYLFSQDENTIALPHNFMRLNSGIKMAL